MIQLRRGEYQAFTGGDARFLYLVPSAAVVRIDDLSQAVLDGLESGDRSSTELADSLGKRGRRRYPFVDRRAARHARFIGPRAAAKPTVEKPKRRIPLQTLVLNVTSSAISRAAIAEMARTDRRGVGRALHE